MLPIKFFIDGKFHFWLEQIISYDATNLKNMVKFYVPTWSIFAGPVTYSIVFNEITAMVRS